MMGVNYAMKRTRNYFFRKTTILGLRLTLLRISAISALLSLLALSTRFLKQNLMEFGEPQPPVKEHDSVVKEEDLVYRSIRELKPDYTGTMDHENEICHECPVCDSDIWNLKVGFEDYEISMYFLDMECANCGTFAKAPTPVDKP